jgi:hypothetical protein
MKFIVLGCGGRACKLPGNTSTGGHEVALIDRIPGLSGVCILLLKARP